MQTQQRLFTTSEVAAKRGVSRQAIVQAVWRGTIVPAQRLANGNYLFTDDEAQPEVEL